MRFLKHFMTATTLLCSGSLFAEAVPEIRCTNDLGFTLHLAIDYQTSLGVLTYGEEGNLTTVENVDTSFNGNWGAAVKGTDLLLTVTPMGNELLGQFIVKGKSFRLRCEG